MEQRVQQKPSHNLFTSFTVATPEVVYDLMLMTEKMANTTTFHEMLICTTS